MALRPMSSIHYIENWAPFDDSHPFLVDYSVSRDGITRSNFVQEFYPLIQVCTRHCLGEAVRACTTRMGGGGRGPP